jgi:hypothetical protein
MIWLAEGTTCICRTARDCGVRSIPPTCVANEGATIKVAATVRICSQICNAVEEDCLGGIRIVKR